MKKKSARKTAHRARSLHNAPHEVHDPLPKDSKDVPNSELGFGSQVAALFAECGIDEPIEEFHGCFVEPMEFEL